MTDSNNILKSWFHLGKAHLYLWLPQKSDSVSSRPAEKTQGFRRRFQRDRSWHIELTGERPRYAGSWPFPASNQYAEALQAPLQSTHSTRTKQGSACRGKIIFQINAFYKNKCIHLYLNIDRH